MKNLMLISLCLFVLLSSCDDEALCLIGSGTTNVYELPAKPFHSVSLMGPVNLSIKQDTMTAVEVIAEPEMIQELDHTYKNGMLEIGFKDNVRCFESEHGVWVNVTVPDINQVYVSGSSVVISEGDLNLDAFTMDINGTGKFVLSGKVTSQNIRVSGSGTIRNEEFQSALTSINVNGSADIDVAVSDQLGIRVTGGATVQYSGSPKINKKIDGSLTLLKMD